MVQKQSKASVLLDYVWMTIGCVIFCLAWEVFLIANHIASGGLAGICTVINFCTGIPVSYSYIILNVVLLGVGFLVMGKGFGFKTIYCIALTTVLFDIIPRMDFMQQIVANPILGDDDKVLYPIIGGLLEAVGISFIFKRGGSTGGTDVVALILNKFWPISPGKVYMSLDIFIIASVLLAPGMGLKDMVYGYIAMLSFTMFLDFLLLGSKATVQVLVFSKKYKEIADVMTGSLNRGVTALNAVGWYTQQESKVLLIMVRKTQLSVITRAIKDIDPNAFVSVSSASAVYGQGFDEMRTGLDRKKKKQEQE
ncbi:MAG: YitT family protein [Bacteroidales bacterium]|nr:YitT family protein [Bacteroidales bacterium]